LGGLTNQTNGIFSSVNIIPNLYISLLQNTNLSLHYPYISTLYYRPLVLPFNLPANYISTPMIGVLILYPFYIVTILKLMFTKFDGFYKNYIYIFLLAAISVYVVQLFNGGYNLRYLVEFVPFLNTINILVIFETTYLKYNFVKKLNILLYGFSIILSVIINLIFSLEIYGCFWSSNPLKHTQIAYFAESFNPFIKHISNNTYKPIQIQFILPKQFNTVESIFASGYGDNSEHVFLYRINQKYFVLGYAWGYTPLYPGISIKPRETYFWGQPLEISSDSLVVLDINLQTMSNYAYSKDNYFHILYNNINIMNVRYNPNLSVSKFQFLFTDPISSKYPSHSLIKLLNFSILTDTEALLRYNNYRNLSIVSEINPN